MAIATCPFISSFLVMIKVLGKFILLTLLMNATPVEAQRSDQHKLVMDDLYPAEAVESFDLRTRKKIDQYFLFADWHKGTLFMKDGRASKTQHYLKYDILNNEVNVNIEGSPYVVPSKLLAGFEIEDANGDVHHFVRAPLPTGRRDRVFFREEVKGDFDFLVYYKTERLPANYVAALDAGSLDQRVTSKEEFFIRWNEKILEIPTKKKSAIKFFAQFPGAHDYLDDNRVNFKKKEDLESFVKFMNQSI